MQIPKYIPKENRRHRIRLCDREVELVYVFTLRHLRMLDQLISKYEDAKSIYQKHYDYTKQFPNPRGRIHVAFDEACATMKELEPQIQPSKILFALRIFSKMNAILESPKLNEKFVSVHDDVVEWVEHPGFVELP